MVLSSARMFRAKHRKLSQSYFCIDIRNVNLMWIKEHFRFESKKLRQKLSFKFFFEALGKCFHSQMWNIFCHLCILQLKTRLQLTIILIIDKSVN